MPQLHPYDRFSTIDQKNGDSQRRQDMLRNRWFEANRLEYNLTMALGYSDPGSSGWNRPGHQQMDVMLAAIESTKIAPGDMIAAESLTRIGRDDPDVAIDRYRSILRAGVSIVCTGENYGKGHIYLANADPIRTGADIERALGIMRRSNQESLDKSELVRAAAATARYLAREFGQPIRGTTKPWVTIVPVIDKATGKPEMITFRMPGDYEDRTIPRLKFQLKPGAKEASLELNRLSANGRGSTAIRDIANEAKLACYYKGGVWTTSNVTHHLEDYATRGHFQPNQCNKGTKNISQPDGELVLKYYPEMVDDDLWARKCAARTANDTILKAGGSRSVPRQRPARTNLFAGLMACGECGRNVVRQTVSVWMSGAVDAIVSRTVGKFRCVSHLPENRTRMKPCALTHTAHIEPIERCILETLGEALFDLSQWNASHDLADKISAMGTAKAKVDRLTQDAKENRNHIRAATNPVQKAQWEADDTENSNNLLVANAALQQATDAVRVAKAATDRKAWQIGLDTVAKARAHDKEARGKVAVALRGAIDSMTFHRASPTHCCAPGHLKRHVNVVMAGGAFTLKIDRHGTLMQMVYIDGNDKATVIDRKWTHSATDSIQMTAAQAEVFDRVRALIGRKLGSVFYSVEMCDPAIVATYYEGATPDSAEPSKESKTPCDRRPLSVRYAEHKARKAVRNAVSAKIAAKRAPRMFPIEGSPS